jgi:hypothetical protein
MRGRGAGGTFMLDRPARPFDKRTYADTADAQSVKRSNSAANVCH